MFNWSDLRFFLEVSRRGRLLSAARHLRVNHTTVSRHISALEKAVGASLFERTTTGYRLTAEGDKLLPLAEAMENTAKLAEEAVTGRDRGVTGALRIGAPDGFGNSFLAKQLPLLRQAHPSLDIELVPIPIAQSVSKREVDIAISLDRPRTGRIMIRKITDYRLLLYAARDYLKGCRPIRNQQDLQDHEFVGYVDEILYTRELRFLDFFGKRIRVGFRSATVLAQYEAIAAGAGLGVLPIFMTAGDDQLCPILAHQISFQRSYWLLIPQDLKDQARVRVTGTFICDVAKAHRELFLGKGS